MHALRHLLPLFFVTLAFGWSAKEAEAQEPNQADIAILSQGLALVEGGDGYGARQLVRASDNQVIRDLVLYFDLLRKRATADFATVAGLVERRSDWPRISRIARKAEEALGGGIRHEELIAFFRRFPPQTGAGALAYVRALEAQGDSKGAQEAIRAAWRGAFIGKTDRATLLKDYGAVLTKEDHLARLNYLVEQKNDAAIQQGSLVGPGYGELAKARLALKARKRNAAALVGQVPKALRKDPHLQIDLAGYYHRAKQTGNLEALLIQLGPTNAGKPESIWRLRFSAVYRHLRGGNTTQAYKLARDHGLTSGSGFAELEWLAGFIALEKLNDPAAGYKHFVRYYEGSSNSPISKGKAAYWAARASEAMGKPQEARSWLAAGAAEETSFYGQLSAARLGLMPGGGLPPQPLLSDADWARFMQDDRAQAMAALSRAGHRWRTDLFYSSLRGSLTSREDFQSLARLSKNLGRIDLQVKTGKAARRKGHLLVDDLFPRPDIIADGTPEQALVLAVTRQESEFNELAVSHADAMGLMQLLPSTARGVAKRLGVAYSKAKLTGDPPYNVTLGRAYLEELIKQFGGTYLFALTSYNAGPNRTQRWLSQNGDPRDPTSDFVLWVESIPFSETRNYVMRILESLIVYRHLLGDTDTLAWNGYNPLGQGSSGARQRFCCQ